MTTPLIIDYAPPQSTDYRQILIRWEKLRLLYNAILIFLVLLITALVHPRILTTSDFWIGAILAGLMANICYCLGPYMDMWLHTWRIARGWSTITLFTIGMLLSSGVAAFASLMPNFPGTI